MAKSFKDSRGSAKKGGEYYKWVDGEQTLRLVGGILPRYVYWKQNGSDSISIECLAFDRDEEKFTNIEKDWFKELLGKDANGKDINCSWSYMAMAINPADKAKSILVPLKKKLWMQVLEVAEELGDPTDPETGWDLIVNREKTGSKAFNVEYTLKQLKCKTRALDEVELETLANLPLIDELLPRPTPAEQKAYITRVFFGNDTETDDDAANEVADDDVPE